MSRPAEAAEQHEDARRIGRSTGPPDLDALYREYAGPLRAFLAARCRRGEADDLSHDVWVKVALSLHRFDGRHFRGWLFEIARNVVFDRGRRPIRVVSGEVDAATEGDPAGRLIDEEHRAAVERCLRGLSERERCVFRGRCAGLSYEDVVASCGCEYNAAQKALHSAKRKLRECLEPELP